MTSNRTNVGFTLLEVMVALAIIATALITLLGSHMMSLNLAHRHKEQTLMALLARQKMVDNYATPFDSLKSGSGDFAPAYPEYAWEIGVESSESENLKKVKIIVRSPDGEFELETMIARSVVE